MDKAIYRKYKLIVKLYNDGYNCLEIANKLKSSRWTIENILIKNKVTIRSNSESKIQYEIIQNFFDKIDTSEKAYFLGFLFADGHNNTNTNSISLQLKASDKEILTKLSNLIYIDKRPIKTYKDKNSYKRSRLLISNKHISYTLNEIGMHRDKTQNCNFPKIKRKFLKDFIRGYFDGDGTIHYSIVESSGRRAYRCSFIGTKNFIETLQKILIHTGIKCTIEQRFYDKKNIVQKLHIHGIPQSVKLFNFMYENSNINLKRKYKKFQDMFNYIENINNLKCLYCNNSVFGKGMCYKHLYIFKREKDKNYTRSKKVNIEIMNELLLTGKNKTYIAKYFGVSWGAINKIIKLRKNL